MRILAVITNFLSGQAETLKITTRQIPKCGSVPRLLSLFTLLRSSGSSIIPLPTSHAAFTGAVFTRGCIQICKGASSLKLEHCSVFCREPFHEHIASSVIGLDSGSIEL